MKSFEIRPVEDSGSKLLLAVALVLLAVWARLLPHLANFTPVAAVAIFGGSILPKRWGLALPLVAMVLSDLIIGLHPLIFFTWGSFLLIAWLSHRYLTRISPLRIVGASFGASVLFYGVSNFGVWLQGTMYTLDFAGLVRCYYNALPFFRNTVLGDLTFTVGLFGVYVLASQLVLDKKTRHEPIRA